MSDSIAENTFKIDIVIEFYIAIVDYINMFLFTVSLPNLSHQRHRTALPRTKLYATVF